jgi:hypothetical protein
MNFSFIEYFLVLDYQIVFQKIIISLHELGYYHLNTIYGIPMLQINRKMIQQFTFLNRQMPQWDKGTLIILFQLFRIDFNCLESPFIVIINKSNQ